MKDRPRFRLSYATAVLCAVLFTAVFFAFAYVERGGEIATPVDAFADGDGAGSKVQSFVFEIDEIPEEPVAVQFFSKQAPTEFHVNSSAIAISNSQENVNLLLPSVKHNTSVVVPPNYLLPGINQLDVFFEDTGGKTGVGRVTITGIEQSDRVFAWQDGLNRWLFGFGIAAGVIAALISIAGLALGRHRDEYLQLLGLGMISLFVGLFSKSTPTALSGDLPAGLLLLGQAGLLFFLGFRRSALTARRLPFETATLAIALLSVCISLWTLMFGPEPFGGLFATFVSIVGILPYMLSRLLQLFTQDIITFRRTVSELENTVSKQAMQLDQKSETIAQGMIRNAILEERQRMMRDIHDGIGSQLLSLMLRVKSGKISNRETSSSIKQSLTDLRLVVDSADHLGGDLAAAFATFRSRALQQFNAANIQMNWHLSEELLGQFKSTGKTLHVYRFMQEAVANIIAHSGAKSATFRVSLEPGSGNLLLEISDDGIGLPPEGERKEGKGLRNLAKRAKLLGAGYSIGSGPNGAGTMVTLALSRAQFPASGHSLIQPS